MTFTENGFLGKQIKDMTANIYNENKDLFDLCYELNIFLHGLLHEFKYNINDLQHVVSICLLRKITQNYQAVIILCKIGMTSEAKIITRSILDAFFILEQICKDQEFVNIYVRSEKRRKHAFYMDIKGNKELSDMLGIKVTKKKLAALQSEIKDINNIRAQELAKKLGFEKMYSTAYRYLSDDVHSNTWSIVKYITTDKNSNITSINYGPDDHEVDKVIKTSAACILQNLKSINALLSASYSQQIEEYEKRLISLRDAKKPGPKAANK